MLSKYLSLSAHIKRSHTHDLRSRVLLVSCDVMVVDDDDRGRLTNCVHREIVRLDDVVWLLFMLRHGTVDEGAVRNTLKQ